jgi:hypothetical protein
MVKEDRITKSCSLESLSIYPKKSSTIFLPTTHITSLSKPNRTIIITVITSIYFFVALVTAFHISSCLCSCWSQIQKGLSLSLSSSCVHSGLDCNDEWISFCRSLNFTVLASHIHNSCIRNFRFSNSCSIDDYLSDMNPIASSTTVAF